MNSTPILFHTEDIEFSLQNQNTIATWLQETILSENKTLGEISCIFCSDEYLLNINQEYLQHDTFTDIVTFNYNEKETISGDLFISIERVKENSVRFEKSFENELYRVLVHGVLHLVGYNDKTKEEARTIRSKEDFYLTLIPEN